MVRRHEHALFGLLLLASIQSCRSSERGERPDTGLSLVERWIESEPAVHLDDVRFFEEVEAFRWNFVSEDDVAPWRHLNTDLAFERTGDGLYIRSSSPDPYIWRKTDFVAEDVHVIRIRHSGLNSAALQLFWAREGEEFSEAQSLTVVAEDPGGPLIPSYSFEVSRHPLWRGRIRRLRIDPTSHAGRRVELFSVSAWRREIVPQRVATATALPVKADFDGDCRNSLLALPASPVTRKVRVPPGATLRVAYGIGRHVATAVHFRVLVSAADAPSREIHAALLRPDVDAGRWHEAQLSLAAFAGAEIAITLATSSDDALDLRSGVPVWANPEVVAPGPRDSKRPNVILIMVDTLRADRLSLYGYERPTTPGLARWAERRAVVFENTVAPAPWTLPSHVSLFTGLNALTHGVNYDLGVPRERTLLAERLRAIGFATAAFTGGAIVAPAYGFDQGFDTFRYWRDSRPGRGGMAGKDLDTGLRNAKRWLQSTREPFFLFVHTYEVHAPYQVREPWASRFVPGAANLDPAFEIFTVPKEAVSSNGWRVEANLMQRTRGSGEGARPLPPSDYALAGALYDSGIARVDEQLTAILAWLENRKLDQRSLVLITSDHGESLGEHESAGHSNLYDTNLMVPLVVSLPDGRGAGQRISAQVRTIDIAPTILDVLGHESVQASDGTSLLPIIERVGGRLPEVAESYAASSNFGVSLRIGNRLKYIYQNAAWPPIHDGEELFDLVADPGEKAGIRDGERMLEFRNQLEQSFRARSNSVRVRVQNRTATELQVTLRGELAHAFAVKGFGLPPAEATWGGGQTTVVIPQGQDRELFLEGAREGELEVKLEATADHAETPTGLIERLRVARLSEPWRARLSGGTWSRGGGALAEGETGVELGWQGGEYRPGSARNPLLSDPALREQLRELGYIH